MRTPLRDALPAHDREFLIPLPELSNSGCRPGKAGGSPPLTLAFLGVDTTVSLDSSTADENASASDSLRIPRSTIDDLFNRFESDNHQLESILGLRLVGWSEITPYLQAVIDS